MTIEEFDVAVVGAGAAGLSAAGEAARRGARVVLLDDNRQPGGQYFRQLPSGFTPSAKVEQSRDRKRFDGLCAAIDTPLVSYRPGATVWDVPAPLTLAVTDAARSGRIRSRAIVIATGARDQAVAFPGWTLPGVMTAGGVQNLIKGMAVAPAGPAVVAGNGPLLLVVAANLVHAGVRVAAVVEAAGKPLRIVRQMARLTQAPAILGLAIKYRMALLASGVPFYRGQTVVAAHGDQALNALDIAPIDTRGNIDLEHKRRIEASTLVAGFGLTSSLELARLFGAQDIHKPLRGGTILVRDEHLMTSVPGVFAAGDGAAIGGVELSLAEGRIAGIEASIHAGLIPRQKAQSALSRHLGRYRRLCRFREGLERVYQTPANWLELLTPETIICRCEDVTLAELAHRRDEGSTSPFQLKAATRIGMGRCQGRNCLGTLAALTGRHQGVRADSVAMPRPRPPARPITLGDLLHEDLPAPDLPDDPHLPRRR